MLKHFVEVDQLKEGCWRHIVCSIQLLLERDGLALNRLMNLFEHLDAAI